LALLPESITASIPDNSRLPERPPLTTAEPCFQAAAVCGRAEAESLWLQSPRSGRWAVLNGTARRIWEKLHYPASVAEISAALAAEFDAQHDEIRESVTEALGQLEALGFVAEVLEPKPDRNRERYLSLLKKAVANTLYPELEMQVAALGNRDVSNLEDPELQRYLRDIAEREAGALRELTAQKQQGTAPFRGPHTMIGLFRLDNIERCAEQVFADGVEGDFLEAGVCRGGATIFMRALQLAHGEQTRRTWVVDSFQGVPPSDNSMDRRYGFNLEESRVPWLACSEDMVRQNFARYDLLDANVIFVPGWLAESLPQAGIEQLAILRVDVDLYSSTHECLELLYDKVVPGGFVIVDDYGFLQCCRDAVDEFRARRGISEPIEWIDSSGIFWRKNPDQRRG
jgi:hypothetical protein